MITSTTTTASETNMPLTIDDIVEAVAKIKTLQRDVPWILINPNGQLYTGSPEDLIPLLASYHPLMTIR